MFWEENSCLSFTDPGLDVFLFFVFFFACVVQHAGSLFPNRGLSPCPLHWERGVLTTGPPGKSRVGPWIAHLWSYSHADVCRHLEEAKRALWAWVKQPEGQINGVRKDVTICKWIRMSPEGSTAINVFPFRLIQVGREAFVLYLPSYVFIWTFPSKLKHEITKGSSRQNNII